MNAANIQETLLAFRYNLEMIGCLKRQWLREAVVAVPRHLFIDEYYEIGGTGKPVVIDKTALTAETLQTIYSDRGLMLRKPPNHSAASQPSLIMQMLDLLELEPGHRVLEIGTGSGWNAALMAYRVGDDPLVHSIDIQPDLVEAARGHLQTAGFSQVCLKSGDGGFGWEDRAPFDRMIATVGSPDIPPAWYEQLAEDGLLLIPFKLGGVGDPLLRLRKSRSEFKGNFVGWSGFQTLQGNFWTDCADSLYPPFGSELADLLTRPTKEMAIAVKADVYFLLFAHLKGMNLRIMVEPTGAVGYTPTVYHKESHSVVSLPPVRAAIHFRGDSAFAKEIVALVDEWVAHGTPKLSDYQINMLPDLSDDLPGQWIIRTSSVALRFSLPDEKRAV